MNENISKRPDDIEYSDAEGEKRAVVKEIRATMARWEQKELEYKKAGFDIVYQVEKRNGKRKTDIYMLKGPEGYSVQVNGKTTIMAETRDDCAKQAYIAGYIGYYTRIEIGKGKAAAERTKKDPAVRERVIKIAGKAANLY